MEPGEITRLLREAAHGDAASEARLLAEIYPELLRLARRQMGRERQGHTLQPSALVNEAYLRLTGRETVDWKNRSQFFAAASKVMRRVLVDHAREKNAAKRSGVRVQVELSEDLAISEDRLDEILQVDEALDRLAGIDDRQSKIVELRFFGGLTEVEIADLLDVSVRTVKRDWSMARAWLHGEIAGAP
ncbi:MAG: sigma-70 family RNA polymerase sigma factor [Bryobacteraceae bacterium]